MLNANQGLPLVFSQGQPSTGGGRSRPHDDEGLHYEPTDEEEEMQEKKGDAKITKIVKFSSEEEKKEKDKTK